MVTLDALQSHCAWRKPTVAGGVLAQKQPDKFPFVLARRGGRQNGQPQKAAPSRVHVRHDESLHRGDRYPLGRGLSVVHSLEIGGFWRRLARARGAGSPVGQPLPGSAELPRATVCALKRRRSRARGTAEAALWPCCGACASISIGPHAHPPLHTARARPMCWYELR